MKYVFLFLVIVRVLWSALGDSNMTIQALRGLVFGWFIVLHSLTCNLWLYVQRRDHRWFIIGSCFLKRIPKSSSRSSEGSLWAQWMCDHRENLPLTVHLPSTPKCVRFLPLCIHTQQSLTHFKDFMCIRLCFFMSMFRVWAKVQTS